MPVFRRAIAAGEVIPLRRVARYEPFATIRVLGSRAEV
jgi:hypothetical protein